MFNTIVALNINDFHSLFKHTYLQKAELPKQCTRYAGKQIKLNICM